jgi:hypothetical protein
MRGTLNSRPLQSDGTLTTINKAGTVGLLSYVRSVALVAFLATGALLLIMLIVQREGGVSVQELQSSIACVQDSRTRVQAVGGTWSWFMAALLIIGRAIFTRKRAQV